MLFLFYKPFKKFIFGLSSNIRSVSQKMDYFHKGLSDGKQKLSWTVLCEYSHLKKKKEYGLEVGISLRFKNSGKLFPFGG